MLRSERDSAIGRGFYETRLADPGLADDSQHAATAQPERRESLVHELELGFAADQSRQDRNHAFDARADQPPGRHRLSLAFQRQLACRLELELGFRHADGRLAHVRLAGRRRGLEPLREDDRIPEHAVVHPRLAAEDARNSVTGVDADVQRELRFVWQLLTETGELRVHLERDAQRAGRVVFVAHGRAEQRHQRIACKLLDVAPVAADDAAEPGDHGIDHLDQLLGIEAVCQ